MENKYNIKTLFFSCNFKLINPYNENCNDGEFNDKIYIINLIQSQRKLRVVKYFSDNFSVESQKVRFLLNIKAEIKWPLLKEISGCMVSIK